MSSERDGVAPGQGLELYRELAEWYPLLTPVAADAEGAAFYRRLFEEHSRRLPRTLLDLESGAGHNAVTDMAYLMRDESGVVDVLHDRHLMGLFPRAAWQTLIAVAGFEPLAVPFAHHSYSETGHEVFLGLRPTGVAVP